MRHALLFSAAILATWALFGCPPGNESMGSGGGRGGSGGSGGRGGGCPTGPVALLNLHITAAYGPLPLDTTLYVSWSAGQEPAFTLGDPSTWGTLAEGANVVCDVDGSMPPPADLMVLVCHLWTSGPTKVEVVAKGFVTYESTLVPAVSAACGEPVPTDVDITLAAVPDAGMGGAPM